MFLFLFIENLNLPNNKEAEMIKIITNGAWLKKM